MARRQVNVTLTLPETGTDWTWRGIVADADQAELVKRYAQARWPQARVTVTAPRDFELRPDTLGTVLHDFDNMTRLAILATAPVVRLR